MKKTTLFSLLLCLLLSATSLSAQTGSKKVPVIAAKDLYTGIKNKTLKFDYNQELVITGLLEETGSSIIYNSSYLLISDKAGGEIYVKAVLADKKKRSEYKEGQPVKIHCRFYEERDHVVVMKSAVKQ